MKIMRAQIFFRITLGKPSMGVKMRHLLGLAVVVLALACAPARAQVLSGVYADPTRPGTGISVEQHGSGVFLAWYGYTDAGAPYWLVGSLTLDGATGIATGPLAEYTGRGFGPNFDPSTIRGATVGSVTLTWRDGTALTMSYTANGRSGAMQMQRFNAGTVNIAGNWWGWGLIDSTTCSGSTAPTALTYTVTQTASSLTVRAVSATDVCTVSGPYTQVGDQLVLSGVVACASGVSGTLSGGVIAVGQRAFSLPTVINYAAPLNCRSQVNFGAVR